jgi:hypothetical protein
MSVRYCSHIVWSVVFRAQVRTAPVVLCKFLCMPHTYRELRDGDESNRVLLPPPLRLVVRYLLVVGVIDKLARLSPTTNAAQ